MKGAMGVCANCQQWQRPPAGDCLNEAKVITKTYLGDGVYADVERKEGT